MAITREMAIFKLEEMPGYVEARALQRLVQDIVLAAPAGIQAATLAEFGQIALGAVAEVADGLRAADVREEIRRFRDACVSIAELRYLTWDLHELGLPTECYDEIMVLSSRAIREVGKLEVNARRRAHRQIDTE